MVRSRTCHHDDTDRITDIEDDTDPDNPKTITYGYDKNGNMTSKSDSSMPTEDMSFVYNSADQMVQAIRGPPESGTVLGLYDYNHAGLRVRHRLSERGNVDYFYDENAVIEERNADDGSLLAFYRYADRLISLDTGSEKQYYHHDALGSTVNLTDESGGVRVSYVLDPWGHIREQVGESVNRQIFTGQEHDERTGLIYFGGRYYDPDIARFITQDAYLGELSVPPSLHRYLYAYSNPTVYIDENGYSGTAVGGVTGFFWGFGQMTGGAFNDLIHGEYRSPKEHFAVWGQNVIAGLEIGASFDVALMSGGLLAPSGSGALGAAGFDALTFGGRAKGSLGEFAEAQAKSAALGAALGPVFAKAAL